ncbi:MAG: 16S rRNA (guanine(527)-N(7))-methyltransferase RsmG [Pseudomonadota bacterium]
MPALPGLNVSRETIERLLLYQRLVEKWNPRINLVSRETLGDIWQRHFVDSAQLFQNVKNRTFHWVDLGSGAGFPGLVIAILAHETGVPARVTLVESDARKAVFLKTVLRETGVKARVIRDRIENIDPLGADVLSARALAELTILLGYAAQHLSTDGLALFPKGKNWRKEVEDAQSKWCFECEIDRSSTNPNSVILRVKGVILV